MNPPLIYGKMEFMTLHPLKFKPRFLPKMWGGRKIQTILGKSPPAGPVGESWELYDFPPGVVDDSSEWVSSEVAEGPLAGKTLHELVKQFGPELYGSTPLVEPHGQFPILIKFLDAAQDLSVQVHPDEAYARANPGAHLKNEAWYIVQADSGARLLKGLRPGVTPQSLNSAVADGSVESLINPITVKAGDCFYLPSGTVHALGAGILAAEVQTPSDTTYRLYDFNRVDPATGKKRALHVEQALKCINFSSAAPSELPAGPTVVKCDHFGIKKMAAHAGGKFSISGGRPVVLMFIQGAGHVGATAFSRGDTILLPAGITRVDIQCDAECVWLEVSIYR